MAEKMDSLLRLLLLTVDGQTYALHLSAVDRVLRMVEVRQLPGAPDVVEGVVGIQGGVVPVASIRRRLGLTPRRIAISDSLVLVRAGERRLCIVAESVLGVIERPVDALVASDDLARGIEHIEGVLRTNDGLVLIQNLGRFFSPEDELSLDMALAREGG